MMAAFTLKPLVYLLSRILVAATVLIVASPVLAFNDNCKKDLRIHEYCKNVQYTELPTDLKKFMKKLKCEVRSGDPYDYGSAFDLNDDGKNEYAFCCSGAPHGPCGMKIFGNISGKWNVLLDDMFGFGGGETTCEGIAVQNTITDSFHDMCINDGFERLVKFMDGKYRAYQTLEIAPDVATTGIQVFDSSDISIEKQELLISRKKIEVFYSLKNNSQKDIIAQLGFLIPSYSFYGAGHIRASNDFRLEVNGKQINYDTEVRATINGEDCTARLKQLNVSIKDFKNYVDNREALSKLGLLDKNGVPKWSVSIANFWKQSFPSNRTVTLRFSYIPNMGYFTIHDYEHKNPESFIYKDACITDKTVEWIKRRQRENQKHLAPVFVDIYGFILHPTASPIQKPIKNFHLVIKKKRTEEIGLCFEHELTKKSDTIYELFLKDYIPEQNIRVHYFY